MDDSAEPTKSWDMHRVTVVVDEQTHHLQAEPGARLRDVLLAAGISPYGKVSRRLNCGGRGICATCGVWLHRDDASTVPAPEHWHDRLAARYGYPRLSCQVVVDRDLHVTLLTDKTMWGAAAPDARWTPEGA